MSRIYRSVEGCCICKVKQSTDEFGPSKWFEAWFEGCFGLTEVRSGDLCFSCVLAVKRWVEKNYQNNDTRNYSRLVDSRVKGRTLQNLTGMTSKKGKKPVSTAQNKNESRQQKIKKEDIFDMKTGASKRKQANPKQREPLIPSNDLQSILDENYWTKEEICCGFIYRGADGEVLIDSRYVNPPSCKKCKSSKKPTSNNSDDIATGNGNENGNGTMDETGNGNGTMDETGNGNETIDIEDLLNPHGTVFTYHENDIMIATTTTYSILE